ncbi:MAG: aerobic C4-dicarboxylate transport protein [Abditibacteriota bacterium]|nr:aerobic C4-dicarboxylate transport protein [Abditibacteriota bacterium]
MNLTPDKPAGDADESLASLPIEAGLSEPALSASPHNKPIYKHIYFWVLLGVVLGVVFGLLFPSRNGEPGLAEQMKPLADAFISLIKMLIAPIIFFTVVGGIASVGDLSKVGRVGLKAFVYFELVTTLAMLIALGAAHLFKPGAGVNYVASAGEVKKLAGYSETASEQSSIDFILHVIPKTFVSAFSEGEILQVLLVSILMGVALAKMGERARPLTHAMYLASQAFFIIVGMVVWLAPLAAFGAMASTVGSAGVQALLALMKMMAVFYLTCLLFVFVVLGTIARIYGFSLLKYLRYIKDEILLVLGTSSSESALPPMMEKLERAGCARSVVGIVLPSGYSFNLDGTSIYLAMAIVFLAQATNTPLSFGQEMGLMGLLLLTSKGAAAVTGGGFITLAATLSSTNNTTLVAGLAILIGIDRFMSEARAITNLIGNGLATFVIAKSEGELDTRLAAPVLRDPS